MQETNTATPVSCEPAQSKCTWTCHKNHLVWKFTREMPDASPAAIVLSLRSRHGHGHVRRAISCRNLQGKCRTPRPRPSFCASLRSWNAHGHVIRAVLCGNLQGKCRTRRPRHPFSASLRSRNAHGHVTSHFVLKFTGNWPHTDATISIQHRDLTVTVRTPQCGHTVWGEKKRAVNEVLPKPSKAYNGNRIKNVYQQPVALLVPDRHKPLPLKGLSTDWLDSTGRCF